MTLPDALSSTLHCQFQVHFQVHVVHDDVHVSRTYSSPYIHARNIATAWDEKLICTLTLKDIAVGLLYFPHSPKLDVDRTLQFAFNFIGNTPHRTYL